MGTALGTCRGLTDCLTDSSLLRHACMSKVTHEGGTSKRDAKSRETRRGKRAANSSTLQKPSCIHL